MNETHLLNRLKEEQVKFALAALKQPDKKDAFEYGYRVGVLAGMEQAVGVLLKSVEEENSRDL